MGGNKGAPGVDGQSVAAFEERLEDSLVWNRMSSGTWFPPPVRAAVIPKAGGTRTLGVPTIADRVAPWNLLHLARLLKDAGGIPAHGNQRGGVPGIKYCMYQ